MKFENIMENMKACNIRDVCDSIESNYGDLNTWCKDEYNENFKEYFKGIELLQGNLYNESRPITDEELEEILTTIPLNLFSVSEILSSFKLKKEAVKSEIKKIKYVINNSDEFKDFTKEQLKEQNDMACINHELLIKGYECVIDRVEHEMSYSKELVMAAKKLWTARQQTIEDAKFMESKAVNNELPDYPQEYIR